MRELVYVKCCVVLQSVRGGLQLEESICDLQHQDVWVVMLMAHQHALARPPHAMLLVVFLEALQARQHRGVFLGLVFFRAEGVVA